MLTLIVRHKIRDFATWKASFERHKAAQEASGLANPRIFHSEDGAETVVLFDVLDVDKAKAFGASQDLQDSMKRGGVLDKPDKFYAHPEH